MCSFMLLIGLPLLHDASCEKKCLGKVGKILTICLQNPLNRSRVPATQLWEKITRFIHGVQNMSYAILLTMYVMNLSDNPVKLLLRN